MGILLSILCATAGFLTVPVFLFFHVGSGFGDIMTALSIYYFPSYLLITLLSMWLAMKNRFLKSFLGSYIALAILPALTVSYLVFSEGTSDTDDMELALLLFNAYFFSLFVRISIHKHGEI